MKKTNLLVCIAFLSVCQITIAQNTELPKEIKVGRERVKVRKEIRIPSINGYQVLKCDLHIHTIFSDGIVWPSLRVNEAWEEGLDVIAITDHIEGQPVREGVMKGNHNYSYSMAEEEARRKDILLIKGGEITRSMPPGHLNALFLEDVNGLDKKDYMDAIEEANRQGAFVFWNHPGWGVDSIKWHDVHTTLYEKGWLHGIEVFNEFEWYPQALLWAQEKGLSLICNTDVHDVTERLYDFTRVSNRPMTLVLAKERTLDAIKEALFAKRTVLFFFDHLMGDENYLRDLFMASVKVNQAHYTKQQRRFVTIENQADIPFQLVKKGAMAKGYPEDIQIPAGSSVIVTLPTEEVSGGVSYNVVNLLTGVNSCLEVNLF